MADQTKSKSTIVTENIQNKIRYHVNRFIFDNGCAPAVDDLSGLLNVAPLQIEQGLSALADNHAIVLLPNSFDIWTAHPFSLFPTHFWVKSKENIWWGNCPWCSFGIASLTKTNTEIFTKLKAHEAPLIIEIKQNNIVQKDYVVHFPIPASKFWDNVIYTCSLILIFQNEQQIDEWCKMYNKPKGEVLPIEQVWNLAQIWYRDHLSIDSKLKTKELAVEMFEEVGLTSDFWKL